MDHDFYDNDFDRFIPLTVHEQFNGNYIPIASLNGGTGYLKLFLPRELKN